MRAQVTVTVAEAKRLIARAIASMPEVSRAMETGQILLKGGTTVSAVAEELAGIPMRISGRISPQGTKTGTGGDSAPHSLLLEKGVPRNIDGAFADVVATMGAEDVAVTGANALDGSGRAALMAGAKLGGMAGRGLSGLMAQGCHIIIACGLEKLIPGSIDDAVRSAGIMGTAWSLGMSVGLIPLQGQVVTEKDALERLFEVKCTVIGAGGIAGAEGSTTMVVEGEPSEIEKAVQEVLSLRGAVTSGSQGSLAEECEGGIVACKRHEVCAYKRAGKRAIAWR